MAEARIRDRASRAGRLGGLGLLLGGALLAVPSCGTTTGGGTDSNTHWLLACTEHSQCGDLQCLCGVCTESCAGTGECIVLGERAACESAPWCPGGSHPPSVCTAQCVEDGDCSAIAAGRICLGGYCRDASVSIGGSSGSSSAARATAGAPEGSEHASGGSATGTVSGNSGGSSSGGRAGSGHTGEDAGFGGTGAGEGNGAGDAGQVFPGGGESSVGGTGAAAGASGGLVAAAAGSPNILGAGTAGETPEADPPRSGQGGMSIAVGGAAGSLSGGGGGPGAAGAVGGGRGGAGAGGASGERMVLDPASLYFFDLPIDSIRNGVAGYDPTRRLCVTLIWDYSSNTRTLGPHCDSFGGMFPYVAIETDTDGPCQGWSYGGGPEVLSARGCVDFTFHGAGGLVDFEVQVAGEEFTGTIVADNRAPGVTTFGFEYTSDVPEDVFVQTSGDLGQPTWLTVRRDGEALEVFERCDFPKCSGEDDGGCGTILGPTENITHGMDSGSVYTTWDGKVRVLDTSNQCVQELSAEAGTYQVEVCYSHSINAEATAVEEPLSCETREFTYPAERVTVSVDNGG